MDLNGYFDPVSLERPEFEYLDNIESFSHHISVHTPDLPIRELDKHQVAIVGVPVDMNGFIKGSKEAPNQVRNKLYQLRKIEKSLKIYDLGNVKKGESINDTYFALRDIVLELRERDITTILIGGSQDLSRGVFLALEKQRGLHHLLKGLAFKARSLEQLVAGGDVGVVVLVVMVLQGLGRHIRAEGVLGVGKVRKFKSHNCNLLLISKPTIR